MSENAKPPIQSVAIVGHGLATWLVAAALSSKLSEAITISVIGGDTYEPSDILYGSVLPPEAYNLHLSIGLDERVLLSRTGTAFCFGARYSSFGTVERNWVQAFHQPLPPISGVPVELLLSRSDIRLREILVSAAAAEAGRFAHPPQDGVHPLSPAEYGYIIDAGEMASVYKSLAKRVDLRTSPITKIDRQGDRIKSVRLQNGDVIDVDVFIDAAGPEALLSNLSPAPPLAQSIRFERQPCDGPDYPLNDVKGHEWGWQSVTRTRQTQTLMASGTEIPDKLFSDQSQHVSFSNEDHIPWQGNCVSIGQAAGSMAPLTIAPMRKLLRDVTRFSELFPISTDMTVEARAYNSAAMDDQIHSRIFQAAFYTERSFFRADAKTLKHPKLERKIRQYEERGYHVSYDHEPFDRLDWAILHDGVGRRPRRPDPLASSLDPAFVNAEINAMRQRIAAVVSQMPTHALYIEQLMRYLDRKGGGFG